MTTWVARHGERLIVERLPEHKAVEFRYKRRKYTTYGWWTDMPLSGPSINIVVVDKDGIVNKEVPSPSGMMHDAPRVELPDEDIRLDSLVSI
jgi:hypothetical protein